MPSSLKGKKRSDGVPDKIKELLAADMQACGGIQEFERENRQALKHILQGDAYTNYFDSGGDKRAVQNLVNNWKLRCPLNDDWLAKVYIPLCLSGDTEELPANTCPADPYNNNDTLFEPESKNPKEQSTPTKRHSKPTQKYKPTLRTAMAHPQNRLGEKLVIPLFDGIILVILWVDSKLSNLEHVISDDGLSVKQRKKIPNPDSAAQLLAKCPFANNPYHVVTKTVEQELQRLKPAEGTGDKWTESVCVTLDEEVLPAFVDLTGNQTDDVVFDCDGNGRQMISFFLKTRASAVPKKGVYRGSSQHDNYNPNDMDVGSDGGAEEARATVERQMAQLRQEQQALNAAMQREMQNTMRAMMQDFMQIQLQAQQQANNQQRRPVQNLQPASEEQQQPTYYDAATGPIGSPRKRKALAVETVPNDAPSSEFSFSFAEPPVVSSSQEIDPFQSQEHEY